MWKASFLILFVSCGWWFFGAAHGAAESQSENYFPLAVGNRWVYASSEGTETEPALETWEVVRQDGNSFVVRIQQPFVTLDGLEERFVIAAEGVQRQLPNAAPSEPQLQLIFKTPPVAGMSWQGSDGRYTITAMGDGVTVPAGTFTHCVEVTRWRKETKVTEISTYAAGVGMIQREETFPVISGFGDFETRTRAHTVLRLQEWKLATSPTPGAPA